MKVEEGQLWYNKKNILFFVVTAAYDIKNNLDFVEYYVFEDLELLGFEHGIKGDKNYPIPRCFYNNKNYKGLINKDFIIDDRKIRFNKN